jgi:hypothetical protein
MYMKLERLIQKLDAELVEMKRSRANGYAVEQEVLKCLKTQRQVKRLISNERRMH